MRQTTGCEICGGLLGNPVNVKEMMFGTNVGFVYAECAECNCIQLLDRPLNISCYYPSDYYSYRTENKRNQGISIAVRQWLVERRNAAQIGRAGGAWGVLAKIYPADEPNLPRWAIKIPELATAERIMDVGCGGGNLLSRLAVGRYQSLVGLDPFLPSSATPPISGVRLIQQMVENYDDEPFDIIMMHHALEHIPNQHATLNGVRRLLARDGICLIRVPMASGRPRQVYQENWVEFDAPRHLFLHTRSSLSRLAANCGLRIERSWDDSDELGYWGSELYRRGVSLWDRKANRVREPLDHFTVDELGMFREQVRQDNQHEVGGRAAFVLRRDNK